MAVELFHPDLQRAARWLPRGLVRPWNAGLLRALPVPSVRLPAGLLRRVLPLEGRGGASVRVIGAPPGAEPRPVLLWLHGGGYVIGAAAQDDLLCARFAQRLGVTVLSVDYRLAPAHPFPTPVEDCFAAYELVQRDAAALGVDATRLIIGGASAGGGLAAGLTLMVHDRQRPPPLLQLLVYPMLDDRTVTRAAIDPHLRVWDETSNAYGWRSYLGCEPGAAEVSDHAAPARRSDFRGLPPAWVGVGSRDLFHDEAVAWAERLRAAGVETTLEIVPGAFHGFDAVLPKLPVSRQFFEQQAAAIDRALAARPR